MFGTGIWRKEIHRRSGNLPQQEFDKILKSLEGKKLVKQVSSVQVCSLHWEIPILHSFVKSLSTQDLFHPFPQYSVIRLCRH